MAKVGRPSAFTPELLDKIWDLIAHGESERSIFDLEGFPDWSCWTRYKIKHAMDEEFNIQYARAKEACMKVWEKRIIAISSDESRDMIPDGKGSFKSDNTAVNRDRLKVDSLKWIMSKLVPKVYGEKQQTEITGKDGKDFIPALNITIEKKS